VDNSQLGFCPSGSSRPSSEAESTEAWHLTASRRTCLPPTTVSGLPPVISTIAEAWMRFVSSDWQPQSRAYPIPRCTVASLLPLWPAPAKSDPCTSVIQCPFKVRFRQYTKAKPLQPSCTHGQTTWWSRHAWASFSILSSQSPGLLYKALWSSPVSPRPSPFSPPCPRSCFDIPI
jgi:hypothetical protein